MGSIITLIIVLVGVVALIIILLFYHKKGKNDEGNLTHTHYHIVNQNDNRYDDFNKSEQELAGMEGEAFVKEALEDYLSFHGGYLFNNFCFKDDNGYSSEIDHILITKSGVFVIETKAIRGTIYGKEDDEFWSNVKEPALTVKTFRNPIKQNIGHINHLKKTIKDNAPKMQSIIIFLDADISHIDSPYVFDISSAIEYIRNFESINKHGDEYVERVYKQIKAVQDKYGITNEEHLDNIRSKYN